MSIETKVKQIELLFEGLDKEIKLFSQHTKLHCITGCGKCCTKPDIEACPLEFFPWANRLFLQNQAEKALEELKLSTSSICHIYEPSSDHKRGNGQCGSYLDRGLICRLFGYAAIRDKYGKSKLATCSVIKEDQPLNYIKTVSDINSGLAIPFFSDYYMKLAQIDFDLGNVLAPINQAQKMALEAILSYYSYRPFPSGHVDHVSV
jgi:Fe-S-cluster containining protein